MPREIVIRPAGIALLSDGSYWVSDNYNHRIQHFTKSGAFLGKVGAVNSSNTPITGTDDTSFDNPMGIAQDSSDNIYVIDRDNKRVQKFSSSGEYISTISNTVIGSYNGIAVDSNNYIWISDHTKDHMWKLDQYGAKIAEAGFVSGTTYDAGNGEAQFNNPMDIEVASDNSIWIADYGNDRAQHISSSGAYLGEVSKADPTGIALSTSNLYVLGANETIGKFELATGNALSAWYDSEYSTSEKFGLSIGSNTIDTGDIEIASNEIWIVDSGNNRLKRTFESGYKALTLEKTVAMFNEDGASISTRADLAGFYSPSKAVGDIDGNSFVLDGYSLKKYNSSGEYIAGYGAKDRNNNFNDSFYRAVPKLAVKGANIYMFANDYDENRISNYAKSSVHIHKTSDMSEVNSFEVYDDTKRGITALADGSVWLAYDNHIAHYSSTGTLLKTVGITNSDGVYVYGSEKNQFNNIQGVASDSSENIYVSEYGNRRIQVFTKAGLYLKEFPLDFYPGSIGISPTTDSLWVTDSGKDDIIRLDSDGKRTYLYDNLVDYSGIGFDNQGNLLLVDYYAHKFEKYSIGTQASLTQSAPEVTMSVAVNSDNTISVDAEAYDEDGYISTYKWEFGDTAAGGATTSAASYTYATTGTYTVTCIVTDNDGLTTTLKQAVLISALSDGTSNTVSGQASSDPIYTLSEEDLNEALADQVETCQNNPEGCGIVVSHDSSLDISASKVEALTTGWHLLGTSTEITDMTMFNTAQAVWIMSGTTWKAYSPNSAIAAEIATQGVGTFSSIPVSSGFWIQK